MGISFIHIADVHLGSALVAASTDKQEYINTAIERALDQVVKTAIDEKVDFIVIAGDLFDGGVTNASLATKFMDIMAPLADEEIHTYVLFGNHDAEGKHNLSFTDLEYLHFFPSSSPETFMVPGKNIALHGQSFADQVVKENLAIEYPQAKDKAYNIGVLHTSLNGNADHDTYAPCSIADLKSKEYDYWALGHIHKSEVIEEKNPTIIYSGNLQGRHTKESGDKGCCIVKIDESHQVSYTFKALNSIAFLERSIDISGIEEMDELIENVNAALDKNNTPTYLRLTLTGRTSLSPLIDSTFKQSMLLSLYEKNIELAKLKNETLFPKSIDEIKKEQNTTGKLLSMLEDEHIRDNVVSVIEEELAYFNSLQDYIPDEESLFNTLKNRDYRVVEDLVLQHLKKATA